MKLQIENISKYYGQNKAVNEVSFTFTPGIYGFLGANGAGKTTLLQMLCGNLRPSSGMIRFNDKNIHELEESYLDILGFMPQGFGFYPYFTGQEFLEFMSAVKGIHENTAKLRIIELLKQVGLEDVAHKKIRTYSGGMKQRLGIAQALLNDPKVLILDEPTAGLDPKERIRLRGILTNLSENKILIIATHIVSDIESIADQIILFKKGSICVHGTVNEIVEAIHGNVWQGIVPFEQSESIMNTFCVSHQRQVEGHLLMRIVSHTQPFQDFSIVYPNLEDVYLYLYQLESKDIGEADRS